MDNLESLFYQGKYDQVIKLTTSSNLEIESLYWRIYSLYESGQITAAGNEIDGIEIDPSEIKTDFLIDWNILQGLIYYKLEKQEKASHLFKEIEELSIKNDYPIGNAAISYYKFLQLDNPQSEPDKATRYLKKSLDFVRNTDHKYLVAKYLFELANHRFYPKPWEQTEELLGLFKECLEIYDRLGNMENYLLSLEFYTKVQLHAHQYNEAIESVDQGLSISQENEMVPFQSTFYEIKARVFAMKRDIDKAVHNFEQAILINKEYSDIEKNSFIYSSMAQMFKRNGDLNTALTHFQTAMEIMDGLDGELKRAIKIWPMMQIAEIHRLRGEFDRASQYYRDVIEIYKNYRENFQLPNPYLKLAKIEFFLGNFETALEYTQKNLKDNITHGMGSEESINSEIYLMFIRIYLELGKRNMVEDYLKKLETSVSNNPHDSSTTYFSFAKAIIAKSSPRMREKLKAQELFENIINADYTVLEVQVESLKILVELSMFEYRAYEEPVVLEDIENYLNQLVEISENQNLYSTLVDTLILRSRLAFIHNQFDTIDEYLNNAEEIAESNDMIPFLKMIKKERESLTANLLDLKNELEGSSVLQKMERLAIFNYIKKAKKVKSS